MAVGVRRIAFLAIAIAVLLVAALAVATLSISASAMRSAVENDIRAATGLDLDVRGPIDVSFFPAGSIVFRDVRLKTDDAEQPALQVGALRADLRVMPLLFGEFRIASLTLDGAEIAVVRRPDGATNWAGIMRQLTRALKPGAARQADVSEIRIVRGELTYRDEAQAIVETLDALDLSLAWPSISKSFGATGQVTWKGRPVEVGLTLSDFLAFISGDKTGLKLRLAGQTFKTAFDGTISQAPDPIVEGTIAADTPSLRSVLRWIGRIPPIDQGLGSFALKAKARFTRSAISLSDVNLEIDGNVAEGVLSYSVEGRRTLQGTLAAEAVDLSPYLAGLRQARGARAWNRTPFQLDALSGMDIDMRLSAAKVTIGQTLMGRAALAANLNAGNLTLSIGEAQIFGGVLKGSIGIAREDESARTRAQLQFTDVDLQACMDELLGLRRVTGKGALSLALDASGANMYALARSLSGSGLLTGQNGAFLGLDVEGLLRQLDRRPLSGLGRLQGGQTPYRTLNVAVRFDNGVATTEDVTVQGPNMRIRINGTASVPDREFDLKGVAALAGEAANAKAEPAFELPFVIQGSWDDPLILPVPEALIRRSPASAPLLDAIREKSTRDAVRSAIERLTGGAPKPAAEPAAQPAAPPPAPATPRPSDNAGQ